MKFVLIGDAAVGKSSLLVRLTDERFLTNPDATVMHILWDWNDSTNGYYVSSFVDLLAGGTFVTAWGRIR